MSGDSYIMTISVFVPREFIIMTIRPESNNMTLFVLRKFYHDSLSRYIMTLFVTRELIHGSIFQDGELYHDSVKNGN